MFQFSVNRAEFVDVLNKNPGIPIRVVRSGTVLPVLANRAIVMKPTVVIHYSITVPTSDGGSDAPDEYVHEERRFANPYGLVDESTTLLRELQTHHSERVLLIQR